MNKKSLKEQLNQELITTEHVVNQSMARDDEGSISDQRTREKLIRIRQALDRIDNGSYGLCLSCGLPIHPDRLYRLPCIELCLTCRQKEEHLKADTPDNLPEGGLR